MPWLPCGLLLVTPSPHAKECSHLCPAKPEAALGCQSRPLPVGLPVPSSHPMPRGGQRSFIDSHTHAYLMSGPWCRDVASKRAIFLAPALALILPTCDWLGGEQCFEKLDFHCLLHSKTSVRACTHAYTFVLTRNLLEVSFIRIRTRRSTTGGWSHPIRHSERDRDRDILIHHRKLLVGLLLLQLLQT